MSQPVAFLQALGNHLAAVTHNGRNAAVLEESALDLMSALRMLLRQNAFPVFEFRDGDVLYEDRLMPELQHWEWSLKLAEAGVGRLEVTPGTTRDDVEGFADEVVARLDLRYDGATAREVRGQAGLRFQSMVRDATNGEAHDELSLVPANFGLEDESAAVRWLHEEAAAAGRIPIAETSAAVELLNIAMHSEAGVIVPLVELKEVDQYTTTHSMNVSCLSMALAEFLGYGPMDVRAIGEAALLHDVGKTRLPLSVLNKTGKLTDEEWQLIQTHTVEGARMLLAAGPRMELAATVAYEHHLSWTGEGYPKLTFPRQPHRVSRLVQVCDVYDALRTRRPFRPPWPHGRAVDFLKERSGTYHDPEFAEAFLNLIKEWEPRQVTLGDSDGTDVEAA
ncbi:MAG: HD domain-containing protein [Gemmatimonadota bacterium]|nr:HD domain-containing protein [Gemmatimonadota bacterium]